MLTWTPDIQVLLELVRLVETLLGRPADTGLFTALWVLSTALAGFVAPFPNHGIQHKVLLRP